jgi:hypothetical protein|tara:strand:+ start:1987 stop:2514 length:528 start_codon:yes stop_codon:yes gene_type:complete
MLNNKKSITITGKRNIDGILGEKNPKRNNTILCEYYNNYYKQIMAINLIYLNKSDDKLDLIKKEINKKMYGYKAQDERKEILCEKKFVDLDNIIERLVESKLKCFYCKCEIALVYSHNRQKNQWTLDRINNKEGHNVNNILIACLKCNLERRDIDKDKFYFTKNLTIKKNDNTEY